SSAMVSYPPTKVAVTFFARSSPALFDTATSLAQPNRFYPIWCVRSETSCNLLILSWSKVQSGSPTLSRPKNPGFSEHSRWAHENWKKGCCKQRLLHSSKPETLCYGLSLMQVFL